MNHDQNPFVQTEMRNLLDNLPAELAGQNPHQFLMHLDHVRQRATQHRLSALRDLICALETALQPVMRTGGGTTVARTYLEAMRATLDCGDLNPAMTEALMANVALRLGGQP
jgi:ATP/maltotriose-dependent transcriptional regulator MalT